MGYLTQTGQPFTGTCEAPCEKAGSNGGAPSGTGGSCTAGHGSGFGHQGTSCNTTIDFDGTNGCCVPGTDMVADIEFFTCE